MILSPPNLGITIGPKRHIVIFAFVWAPLAISIFGVHSQIISANPKGVVCKMQCLHCFVDFNHKKVEYQREFNAKKII